MIRQLFNHPTRFSYEIQAGLYQLHGPDGKKINREHWNTSISPGMTVTMSLSPEPARPVSGVPFGPGIIRPPPPPQPPNLPFSERIVAPASPTTHAGEWVRARDGTTGLATMKTKPKVRRSEAKYFNLPQWIVGKKPKKRRPGEEPENVNTRRPPDLLVKKSSGEEERRNSVLERVPGFS